jgi:hypothetical protein
MTHSLQSIFCCPYFSGWSVVTGPIEVWLEGPRPALKYMKLDGMPYLHGPMPFWATKTDRYMVSSAGPFSCPTITSVDDAAFQLFVDASYDDYSDCICDRGTYGEPPNCLYIPPTSQLQVASSTSISNTFSPAEYGEHRQTVGMDTSWLLSPPANSAGQLPVVIYLTFYINSTLFNAATDVSNYNHCTSVCYTLVCVCVCVCVL